MTDDFEEGQATLDEVLPSSVEGLSKRLDALIAELRKFSSPGYEPPLLELLRKALLAQNETNTDLRRLLRELDHDLRWLRKHIGALHLVLGRIVDVDEPPKPG